MNSHVPGNRNESWTDEKHVHFLNSMEAWFVCTMLENNDRCNLRLDRQLPDSSESTLDCKHHSVPRRKKHASSDSIGTTRSKMKVKTDKRSKRPPPPQCQPRDSSKDQVGATYHGPSKTASFRSLQTRCLNRASYVDELVFQS